MNACRDHYTRSDRLGTSLAAKRASAIAYLRSRGKYIIDLDCNWRPTPAKATDIRKTISDLQSESAADRIVLGLPALMKRQVA